MEKDVFSTQEAHIVAFQEDPNLINLQLHQWESKGDVVRLKRGLYAFAETKPKEAEIAKALYWPCYFSLEYVLSLYSVIPESVFTYTLVTPKSTRSFETPFGRFTFQSLKKEAFTGFDSDTLVAYKEKALVDYFYLNSFRLKPDPLFWRESRLEAKATNINFNKVFQYAKLFHSKKLSILLKDFQNFTLSQKIYSLRNLKKNIPSSAISPPMTPSFIYLDHASTTPVDRRVLKKMLPYFGEKFGNPSSVHSVGQESRSALDHARDQIASVLNCESQEIYFTGSGTESCNFAIRGIASAYRHKGNHLITSTIEHHAVLHTMEYLEKEGFCVTYLSPDRSGLIDPRDVRDAITDQTILLSIMYANNEIGTIQAIPEIGKMLRERGVFFHTDACQAAGALSLDVASLHVDLLTINGSKIYGPKGSGALYVRKGIHIAPIILGGGQEFRKRAGTENVPAIVGLGEAITLAQASQKKENKRLIVLRDLLIDWLLEIPDTQLNGHRKKRLPNNINVTFEGIDAASLLVLLDKEGIMVSSGSACTSGLLKPSHVLKAIGLPDHYIAGSLRFTLGKSNTAKDIDFVTKMIRTFVRRLRKMPKVF